MFHFFTCLRLLQKTVQLQAQTSSVSGKTTHCSPPTRSNFSRLRRDQTSIFRLLTLFFAYSQLLCAQAAFYPSLLIQPDLTSNAHVVVRSSETVFQVENESDATIERNWVVTILRPEGKYAAQTICLQDAFSEVKKMEGRLYDGMGNLIHEGEKKDIVDYGGNAEYQFTDTRLKMLSLEYNTFPFTVEFKTKERIRGFFRIPEFEVQRLGEAVQQAAYTIVAPSQYKFKWKGLNTDIQPSITTSGTETIWKWSVKNLAAKPDETQHPYFHGQYSEVLFAPEKVKIDDYSGDLSNWTQAGRFFYALNRDRDHLPADMQAVVRDLTANAPTNREKIAVLYRYLQANYRYVSIQLGLGGWQTFDAEFVSKKKYGDCKALSNYMKALLKAADIPAYQALIFGDEEGAPTCLPDLAAPRFNHVVLYVPGENLWLECTSHTDPPGYLGDFTAGRAALLLMPDGGKLVQTPPLGPAASTRSSRSDIALDEAGNATVQSRLLTTGSRHDPYRALANEKNQAERDKHFSEGLPVSISRLLSLAITTSESLPEAGVDYRLQTAAYAARSGKRMFVPLTRTVPIRRSLPANDVRILDLHIANCYTLRDTVVIHFPAGYEAENVPTSKKIESEFGVYEMQIEQAADQIRIVRTAEIRPVSVPATRYGEVRQFYLDVAKADGAQAVLVKKG